MLPEIEVLGVTVQTFGLTVLAAYLASIWLLGKRFEETGRPIPWATEGVSIALLSGLLGAFLYYEVEHFREHEGDIVDMVLSGGGMVWYGGLIGGTVGALIWASWRGILNLSFLDATAPVLAMSQAIGRVGCQLSGDGDYGSASDLPWAMGYPDGVVPTAPGVTVHPTPVYETLALALIAWFLWRQRDVVRPGVLFAMYLVLAGMQRFLVEFVRINDDVVGELSLQQLQSLGLIVAGALWLVYVKREHGGWTAASERAPRREPAGVP